MKKGHCRTKDSAPKVFLFPQLFMYCGLLRGARHIIPIHLEVTCKFCTQQSRTVCHGLLVLLRVQLYILAVCINTCYLHTKVLSKSWQTLQPFLLPSPRPTVSLHSADIVYSPSSLLLLPLPPPSPLRNPF